MHTYTTNHQTPLGTMWSVWSDRGLYSLNWETPNLEEVDRSATINPQAEDLDRCLLQFFDDGQEAFSDLVVDPTGWTEFTARVYAQCRTIAPASTLTYKGLAKLAGNEKASRAVGAAMSRNRILLVIPCHRVVAGGGDLRGFSAPGGLSTKRRLLELERQKSWPADLFANATT